MYEFSTPPERTVDMIADGAEAHALEQHLQQQLRALPHAPSRAQKLCVALSGGADSTALLVAASHVVGAGNVRALHADHALQSQSADWVAHCQRLCDHLGVELLVGKVHLPKGNVEAAARAARYDFFAARLRIDETLLLGHHGQDQLETVFMRLVQGRSLLPMRAHGRLGKGAFLRPLLALSQQQLLDYLSDREISWIEDPSNCDQTLTRNFLRHQIMPLLLQRWPLLGQAVQRVTEWQQGQNALLHELLKDQGNEVNIAELPQAEASRRVWLRVFLELRGHFEVTDRALEEFNRQSQQGDTAQLKLAPAGALMGWRDTIYYEPDISVYAQALQSTPARLRHGEVSEFAGRRWTLAAADPSSADGFYSPGTLCLSTRRKGLSMLWRGRHADSKDVLRELGVPPWRRDSLPLVLWQDEIVAVSTLAVSERFRDHSGVAANKGSFFRLVIAD